MSALAGSDTTAPRVGAGGLVTVAYIKARLDEGADQLGIFAPLVRDVIPKLSSRNFSVAEVQEAVARVHGVAMPQETVGTLLRRATRDGLLKRDAGRFQLVDGRRGEIVDITAAKASVSDSISNLSRALLAFIRTRGLESPNDEAALDLLLNFLLHQQVAVILGVQVEDETRTVSRAESLAIAEFIRDVASTDVALKTSLSAILEGLVLYHAAFLPDLADVTRKFNNLTVAFDTVLVRQALGYEGTAPRAMLRETIDLLAASGVRCVVFDKTVDELQRLLRMYQDKLGTSAGRASLRPGPMVRHFLTQRYSPSDVQEMSALLEGEIRAAGLTLIRVPRHEPQFTSDEKKLASRLVNPRTGDVAEPRIEHDVDCVAAVLTMRRGHRANHIEGAGVVFATMGSMVIKSIRDWWELDERETGIPPVVHIRALANLAWLKRPKSNPDFQLRDLVTLCASAMRPTARTWGRFLTHLERLHSSNHLTADQLTAIVVSSMSDRLLREAEFDSDDPADIDAGTLDEVVDRVVADYSNRADERIRAADSQAANAVELVRRRELKVDGTARKWATIIASASYWGLVLLVVTASIALALNGAQAGLLVGVAGLLVAALELVGLIGIARSARDRLQASLHRRFRTVLGADELVDTDVQT